MDNHHHHHHQELQLLPSIAAASSSKYLHRSRNTTTIIDGPSLDLQLSICGYGVDVMPEEGYVEAMKWQAAEQIRLAALEKAYAERVRELTRREMELAQSEFARARHVWERAREEVERAERLKERATRRIDPTCMEITCQSCRQRFRRP